MSNYMYGFDYGSSDDYSIMTIMRRPYWFELLARRLKLSKATWEYKLIKCERVEGME